MISTKDNKGFTLVELVMIIVLMGILAVSVSVKWPSGMKEKTAAYELKRAIRFAQHVAMTRSYDSAKPWGIEANGTTYSVRQKSGAFAEDPGGDEFPKTLMGEVSFLAPKSVWFNRFGEPLDNSGNSITAPVTFNLSGSNLVKVYPQTGYAE